MPKRALITGVSGFVGAHLLGHLMKNTDWEIVGIDSFRHKGKSERINDLLKTYPQYRERMTIITHDLKAPIAPLMDGQIGHIDYLFNIASNSHVDRSITEPRDFIENNVSLVLTLLEFMRARQHHDPISAMLQCSTDEVYGPAVDFDHPEGNPHRPSNPYSASKAAQEDICFSYWRTFGLPVMITNTMNMYGELQETEKYVPMIIKAINEGRPVTAHVSPEGKPGSRYYLHVRNMCDGMLFLINNHPPTLYPADDIDRFNIVSSDEVNNIEMAHRIAKIMGKAVTIQPVNFHESRPGHDLRYGLDGGKLRSLGWTLPIPFDESMERTVHWYLNNPAWLQ